MTAWLTILHHRTPLGWLQLRHHKNRLIAAIAGVAFANILVFMQLGFLGALEETAVLPHRKFQADIVLISTKARDLVNVGTFPYRRLAQALGVPGIIQASALYVGLAEWTIPFTNQRSLLTVFGANPSSNNFSDPELRSQAPKLLQVDSVLFDKLSRGNYSALRGRLERNEVIMGEVNGHSVRVEGAFRLGASFLSDSTLVCSEESFMRIFRARTQAAVSIGLLRIKSGENADEVVRSLSNLLPGNDVQIMTLKQYIAYEERYLLDNQPIGFVFAFGVIMGLVVGFVILYQILFTDVNEHLSEYATFSAMGFQHSFLLNIVFEQALILALLGFAPSLLISFGLYQFTSFATALPIDMPWSRPAIVFLMTLIMCIISGTIAARRLRSADPADLF
jgi:putative ABC transport system permease protein